MAPGTFAETLKEARRKAGLSQNALGRRAGLTGSYVCLLESRRRPPPTPRVVRALCRVLAIDDGPLQEAAALERAPDPVRRRIERMTRERGRVQRTRDRLLTTTLYHLAQRPRTIEPMGDFLELPTGLQSLLGRMVGRVRTARTLKDAEAQSEEILEEASPRERDVLARILPAVLTASGSREDEPRPAAHAPASVPLHADLARAGEPLALLPLPPEEARPGRFFWRAATDDGHPRIEAGDLLLVAPDRAPREGDFVVLRHEGRDRVGTYGRRGDEVRITFPRPDVPPLRIAAAAFAPVGVVLALRREMA